MESGGGHSLGITHTGALEHIVDPVALTESFGDNAAQSESGGIILFHGRFAQCNGSSGIPLLQKDFSHIDPGAGITGGSQSL